MGFQTDLISKYFDLKYQRKEVEQKLVHADILQSQQTDVNGELTDTLLICNGGTIRAHGFLLQSASPFLQSCFVSQGEHYPFTRELLLPDFRVKDVENMLSLIYKGFTNLESNDEVERLQETLNFFQVSGVDFNYSEQKDWIWGSLRVQPFNRIPQDILRMEMELKRNPFREEKPVVDVEEEVIEKKPQVSKKRKKLGRPKSKQEKDPDFKPRRPCDVVDLSSGDEEKPPKKAKQNQAELSYKLPVIKLHRIKTPPPKPIRLPSPQPQEIRVPATTPTTADNNNDKEDSDTDSECNSNNEKWKAPNYKNKNWLLGEMRRCQKCDTSFDTQLAAFNCFSSHKNCVRCYFCFRIYPDTEMLFKHYARRHKKKRVENAVMCPYCEQQLPFKAVSCHVISKHMSSESDPKDNGAKNASVKPTSVPSSSSSSKIVTEGSVPNGDSTTKSARGHRSRSVSIESTSSKKSTTKKAKKSPDAKVKEGTKTKKRNGMPPKDSKPKVTLKKSRTQTQEKRDTKKEEKLLKVPDLNLVFKKKSQFGKTVVFKLGLKRNGNK